MIIVKIHSSVDVITNSSTVIFTYQDSISQTKELVNEIIKLSGKEGLTAEDVFHYGVFCNTDAYKDFIENIDEEERVEYDLVGYPEITITYSAETKEAYWEQRKTQDQWIEDYKLSIMKGEVDKADWMKATEEQEGWSYYEADRYLNIIPKSEEYKDLASKLISFLNSPHHEATRDG